MIDNQRLDLLPLSAEVNNLYKNHNFFHAGDSGLDLFIAENRKICAGETALVHLGLKAAAYDSNNKNVSFLIFPRSSIYKTPLRLSNGIGLIDAGYRGELMACLDNIKNYDYEVKFGDRLLQAVFFNGSSFQYQIVQNLPDSERGLKGLGSTSSIHEKCQINT